MKTNSSKKHKSKFYPTPTPLKLNQIAPLIDSDQETTPSNEQIYAKYVQTL